MIHLAHLMSIQLPHLMFIQLPHWMFIQLAHLMFIQLPHLMSIQLAQAATGLSAESAIHTSLGRRPRLAPPEKPRAEGPTQDGPQTSRDDYVSMVLPELTGESSGRCISGPMKPPPFLSKNSGALLDGPLHSIRKPVLYHALHSLVPLLPHNSVRQLRRVRRTPGSAANNPWAWNYIRSTPAKGRRNPQP